MNALPIERLLSKVDAISLAPDACWNWVGAVDPNGYGRFSFGGRMLGAHRVAYTLLVDAVPSDRDLDHLCRNRRCVRPSHLEPVTRRENLMRGETLVAAHAAGRDCGFAACRCCVRFRQEPAGVSPNGDVLSPMGDTEQAS